MVTGYIRHFVYRRRLGVNQYSRSDWLMALRLKRSDGFQLVRSRMQFTPDLHKNQDTMANVSTNCPVGGSVDKPIYCCINGLLPTVRCGGE